MHFVIKHNFKNTKYIKFLEILQIVYLSLNSLIFFHCISFSLKFCYIKVLTWFLSFFSKLKTLHFEFSIETFLLKTQSFVISISENATQCSPCMRKMLVVTQLKALKKVKFFLEWSRILLTLKVISNEKCCPSIDITRLIIESIRENCPPSWINMLTCFPKSNTIFLIPNCFISSGTVNE